MPVRVANTRMIEALVSAVRWQAQDKSEQRLQTRALRQAGESLAAEAVLLLDAGFHGVDVQQAKVARYVLRGALNFTTRRAQPSAYKGRGRRPTKGELVRPLPRKHKGKTIAATPPDQGETWQTDSYTLRAEWWFDRVRSAAPRGSPTFQAVLMHDPRYTQPILLISHLRVAAAVLRGLYGDRWPIEHLPQSAKQLIGAERQSVSAAESRLRLPELSLLANAALAGQLRS